jgi:hypothetical protein
MTQVRRSPRLRSRVCTPSGDGPGSQPWMVCANGHAGYSSGRGSSATGSASKCSFTITSSDGTTAGVSVRRTTHLTTRCEMSRGTLHQ